MSYVLLALFYAIVGIGMGASLIEFALKPYFLAHPLSFPMGKVSLFIVRSEFVFSIISLIIVSIIAGLIPSWRVAREKIIRAIWVNHYDQRRIYRKPMRAMCRCTP
jgi:putative ABC transport system permease protein